MMYRFIFCALSSSIHLPDLKHTFMYLSLSRVGGITQIYVIPKTCLRNEYTSKDTDFFFIINVTLFSQPTLI
jgi:hypothetical protein